MTGPRRALGFATLACAAALGLVAAAAGGAAPGKAAKPNPCKPKGSKTVLATASYRVYVKRGPKRPPSADPSTVTSLCGTRTGGGPVRLAIGATFSAGTLSWRSPQLAGRYASLVSTSDDRGGYSEELEVYDLRRRRRTLEISPEPPNLLSPLGVRFSDVALVPSGNVAWIQPAASAPPPPDMDPVLDSFEVRASQYGQTVLLDSGKDIVPTSLAVSGSTLYWTNGTEARTAQLP